MLTPAEEAIVVEFRRRTLLPLDDILGSLRDTIPTLSRSALHRCLQRHGISRLPKAEDSQSKRKTCKATQIGYDNAQLRSAESIVHMLLAIDRVSKFAYVGFHATAKTVTGAVFMRGVVKASPTKYTKCSLTPVWRSPRTRTPNTTRCGIRSIASAWHWLTKPYHPWTNSQAERMNRTVKDANTTTENLRDHVLAFVSADNVAKHLKALLWRTPLPGDLRCL